MFEEGSDSDSDDVFSDTYNGIEKTFLYDPDQEYKFHRQEGAVIFVRPKLQQTATEQILEFYRQVKAIDKDMGQDQEEQKFDRDQEM